MTHKMGKIIFSTLWNVKIQWGQQSDHVVNAVMGCMCANEWSHLCGNRMTSASLPRGGHTAFCGLAGLFPGLPDSYWVSATVSRGRVWPLLETFGLRSVSVYIWRFFKKQSTSEWGVTDINRLLKSHYLHFPEWIPLRNEWEQCLISSVRRSHTMWNVME